MQATLTIRMDNAAFADSPGLELARILRDLADKAERGISDGDEYRAMDYNGNRVGSLIIEGSAE